MKKHSKKQIWTGCVTLGLFVLLLYWVFHKNYRQIFTQLKGSAPGPLAAALGLGVAFFLLEALACRTMVRRCQTQFTLRQACDTVFLAQFANVTTLGAGSVPIQSVSLHRCGIPAGRGVSMMTLNYALHKTAVFVYATAMLLAQGSWLTGAIPGLNGYLIAGYAVIAVIILALVALCSWQPVQRLVRWGLTKLPHTGKWPERSRNWSAQLDGLFAESRSLLKNPGDCARVLGVHVAKLAVMYLIPFACLRAVGCTVLPAARVQLLAALMMLLTSVLPNLAGMGPAELSFILLFSPFTGTVTADCALLLYRAVTYYLPFLFSMGVFFAQRDRLGGDD